MSKGPTKDQLQDCFKAFDSEQHSHLTKKEVKTCVRAMGKTPTEKDLDAAMKSLGEDVTFSDFEKVYNTPSFPGPESQDSGARTVLKLLDPNGSGWMAESEMRQILATIGEPMSHGEIDLLMEEVKTNEKGQFRYDDFVTMMVTGYLDVLQSS